jgi:hypothetical protein
MYANPADSTSSIEKDEIKLFFFILTLKSGACTNWNVVEAIFTAPLVVSLLQYFRKQYSFCSPSFFIINYISQRIFCLSLATKEIIGSWASSSVFLFF